MVTIFSPMRPFVNDIGIVQKQAISSWINIFPSCEIIVIEDEEKTCEENLKSFDLKILKSVNRSISGVPLLDSMFEEVLKVAKYDIICYITADILLPHDFCSDILFFDKLVNDQFGDYVGICSRIDVKNPSINKGSLSDIEYYDKCLINGILRKRSGIDLWVFRKSLKINFLPFPIGRCLTDNWFVHFCRSQNITVIDFSEKIRIIHQYHTKSIKLNPYFDLEKIYCHKLFENASFYAMDLYDSNFIYTKNCKIIRPRGIRLFYLLLSYIDFYRFILSIYRKFKNPLYRF